MTAQTTATTATKKLQELVLYVARRCEEHHFFGTIKLNKILLYSDWGSYRDRGRGVTGIPYIKDIFGPAPKGIDQVIAGLVTAGDAVVLHRGMLNGLVQDRVVPIRDADLSIFDAEDIATVNDVVDRFRKMPAKRVSDLTHDTAGWLSTHFGEEIPYSASLIPDQPIPLTLHEMAYGMKLAEELAKQNEGASTSARSA
jgi:Protein of unknown function (DUF4065)